MPRIYPITFRCQSVEIIDADSGEARKVSALVPLHRFSNVFGRQHHDGEDYTMVPLEARSRASHNHYFAAVNDAFDNLPERIAARWPSAEHFRKWCLIEVGWFQEREIKCPDEQFARGLAAFVREHDEFARITVHCGEDGWSVIIRRAKSQSAAAMGKQAFEDSKKAVLELMEHMTGVDRGALMKNAGRSA